jgi:beta-lactamase class D
MDIVKKIMVAEKNSDYTLRAKTGWAVRTEEETGWYVGWVETKKGVFFFATCLQNTDPENNLFAKARIEITRAILRKLEIIPR